MSAHAAGTSQLPRAVKPRYARVTVFGRARSIKWWCSNCRMWTPGDRYCGNCGTER